MMVLNLHIGEGVTVAVNFMLNNFEPLFNTISAIISFIAGGLTAVLEWLPIWAIFAILFLLGLWRVGWRFALFSLVALWVVAGMNLWDSTMETLSLVITSTFVALGIGLPSGVVMAKSEWVALILRPVLDFMQTLPAFVYLIPAAMFFGLGQVPGTIATVIFSMPPAVRLMNLGIRHVDVENVEAGRAFGCTPMQLLFKVELPLALPSIMAGINQTIMLALSMVVIASMIGAGGLGNTVLTGIQQLNVGLGFEGGLGVVILAIILDRVSQSFGQGSRGKSESLLERLRKALGRGNDDEEEGTTTPAPDK